MTKIDLRTVKARQNAGLKTGYVPEHVPGSGQVQLSRANRVHQIIKFVLENPGCTRLQIARGIGMKKSGYFVQLVQNSVDDGYLVFDVDVMPNGMEVYLYRVRE